MNPAGYGALLLCGPLAAIAAVWLADRVGVPYPVLLVGVGALLAWLPWVDVPTAVTRCRVLRVSSAVVVLRGVFHCAR